MIGGHEFLGREVDNDPVGVLRLDPVLQCQKDVRLAGALEAIEQGCQRPDRQSARNTFRHLDRQLVCLTRDEGVEAHDRCAGAGA